MNQRNHTKAAQRHIDIALYHIKSTLELGVAQTLYDDVQQCHDDLTEACHLLVFILDKD